MENQRKISKGKSIRQESKAEAKRLRQLGVEKVDKTVRADIAQSWKKLNPEERHQWMLNNMDDICTSNIGENSGEGKSIEESDEDKAEGGNLVSRCRVASFAELVSTFSSDQQAAVKENRFWKSTSPEMWAVKTRVMCSIN